MALLPSPGHEAGSIAELPRGAGQAPGWDSVAREAGQSDLRPGGAELAPQRPLCPRSSRSGGALASSGCLALPPHALCPQRRFLLSLSLAIPPQIHVCIQTRAQRSRGKAKGGRHTLPWRLVACGSPALLRAREAAGAPGKGVHEIKSAAALHWSRLGMHFGYGLFNHRNRDVR